MRSSTKTLIEALKILEKDIVSGDGVANAAIGESADRLAEQKDRLGKAIAENTRLARLLMNRTGQERE